MTFSYERRPASAPMGRFGGGWQWKIGIQAGHLTRRRGTIIISVLVASVRISWGK